MVRRLVTYFAPRTCTEEVDENDFREEIKNPLSSPLKNFREVDAYVLLGSPGAGKTTVFKHEKKQCENSLYITARDFITFGDKHQWHDIMLFIDGLDEIRAGAADGRTPFDKIRKKLDELGNPRFRLSCREADWFGTNDRNHLKTVSRSGKITVLRLDPLSDDAIREILRHHHPDVSDAGKFINTARERGIGALLRNPQSLRMLADAVTGEAWPETRLQTFELACEKLVHEPNREHELAHKYPPSVSDILTAAGRLCAVQLLTGNAGYTLPGNESNHEYLRLEQIPDENREILHHVLRTKLFESPPNSDDCVAPIHRQIAEFLAARYLTDLVEDGLPIRRILALMTGHDGGIVSELRGLSAWLAAHSKRSRSEIIARDPLGTILYGDVKEFSTNEKYRLLECLNQEAEKNSWFAWTTQMDSRLEDIVTQDMEEKFREILTDLKRDDTWQSFVLILLESLRHGQMLPGITNLMMKIVRDDRWRPGVKHSAFAVLIRHRKKNDECATAELKKLLTDIHTGSISDPDDNLLGSLLHELYPGELFASDIWQYLRMPKGVHHFGGMYCSFWITHIPEKSTSTQLAELLDALVKRFDQLRPVFADSLKQISFLSHVPAVLLSRLLETSQEEISPDRLFDWLGIVLNRELRVSVEETEIIKRWLACRPDIQKKIMELGLKHCAESSDVIKCMCLVERRLFNARPPADFGNWCLEQAINEDYQNVADWLIFKVANSVYSNGFSRKVVEQRVIGNTHLLSIFTKRLADLEKGSAREKKFQNKHEIEAIQGQQEWHDSVKPHETALHENRCKPAFLHQLANVYFGRFIDVEGETPRERFQNIFGNDKSLIEAVLAGLRGSVDRSDIPSASEIIDLATRNKSHYLALPFLAGLKEIPESKNHQLTERQMSQALAFHYTMPVGQPPDWYKRLLASYPDIVSDTFVRYVRSQIRGGSPPGLLYELVFDQDYIKVARLASLPLLEAFPVRCTKSQLLGLRCLLWAALLHCEQGPFLELIERKLGYSSMNVAQRVYWLATGLLASPTSYHEKLESYTAGNERRTRNLAELVRVPETGRAGFSRALTERLEIPTLQLQLLIRLLGASCRPRLYAIGISDQVCNFIDQLASRASKDAAEALHDLMTDDHLQSWSDYLTNAAYRQNLVRREADFRHYDIGQVFETLNKLRPANAADLAALMLEYLREIAHGIRHGNTSAWRQYWNLDQKRPKRLRHEDVCRDALLSDLQCKMKGLDIEAQPEGRYADDKRSDIRVSCGDFNVPVEIKKSDHPNLWSAIKEQLIKKYTRDPGADGYGIYLVFWFGRKFCQASESAPRPKSANELEKLLRDTLSADEARKISVCVIDVAKPE